MELYITILISIAFVCITIYIIALNIIDPYLKGKNEIKEREVKNDLYRIYADLDPEVIQENIDLMIENKISEYILINIRTRENQYITAKETDEMVKKISAELYLNLSDMYITFIRLVYNISDSDDLLVYINNKVKIKLALVVKENNELI